MMNKLILPAFIFLHFIAFAQVPSDGDLPQKEIPSASEKQLEGKSINFTDCEESGEDPVRKADCFFSLGTSFQREQNFEKAKAAFEQALALYSENKRILESANTLNNLGAIHLRPTSYWRALEFYQKAQAAASEAGSSETLINSYEGLANVYEKLYMYKDALEFRRKYEAELGKFRERQLSKQYEITEQLQKEEESKFLSQGREIKMLRKQSEKYNQQRNIGIITTSFAGLLAFLAVGYTMKKNKRPIVQNDPVPAPLPKNEEDQERLKNSSLILEDLKEGLNKIQLLSNSIAHKTSYLPDVKDSSETIKYTSGKMLEKMGDLLWVLNPGASTLSALIVRIQQFAKEHLKDTGVKPVFHVPEELPETDITREGRIELYAVVKESLENVVNHSAASKVIISANLHRDMLLMTITDNGNGFIIGDHNTGQGVKSMKVNMENIGGVLEISSKIGQGTMISFSVSLNNIKV